MKSPLIRSPERHLLKGAREKERGVTLLLAAVGMFSLLAMSALAIDVVSLYVASGQAQQAADAAALAGAEALVSSGTTSDPFSVPLNSICNGSTGDADLRAQAIATQNGIPGISTTVTTACPTPTSDQNPFITVTVTRTGIPTFFARIWGGGTSSVVASAKAEAYNPSGPAPRPTIQIQGVKPWLIYNCNIGCPAPAYFDASYNVLNPTNFIGKNVTLTLIQSSTTPGPGTAPAPPPPVAAPSSADFYAIDPPAPSACPSTSAVSCGQIGTGPPNVFYHDNIACTGSAQFGNNQFIGPGQPIQVDARSQGNLQSRTTQGTQCLIHASGNGLGQGQDSFISGVPVTIVGGFNNPNPSLRGITGIHRSDSVVTAPVFNCPVGAPCNGTAQLSIVGFLQLGIEQISGGGDIQAVILNASGTDPASTVPPAAIQGPGASPVPVRLIQ